MGIYWVLLGGTTVFGMLLCEWRSSRWGRMAFCALTGVALAVISGMRFLVGYDYALYWPTFTESFFWDFEALSKNRMEKGYLMVNRLIANLSIEGYFIFFTFGILFAAVILFYIYRYSALPWLSVGAFICFGLFYNSLCFMRQFTAMLILIWALQDIEQRRPLRFLVLVLLASTFHISALILLPFYFVLKIPLNRFILPVYVLISGLCYYFSVPILQFVTRFYYSAYKFNEGSEMMLSTDPLIFLGFLLLLVLCLCLRRRLVALRAFNSILINCLFFGTFFELIGLKHAIISRVAVLFMTPGVILLVPALSQVLCDLLGSTALGKRHARLVTPIVWVGLLVPMLVFHAYLLHVNYNGVVPYQTIAEM